MSQLELTIIPSDKLYQDSGTDAPEVAEAYLSQALDDTKYPYTIHTPNISYPANDSDPNLTEFFNWVQNNHPNYLAKDSNHLIVTGTTLAAGGRRASFNDNGKIIADMSEAPPDNGTDNDRFAAIHGTLHEVGHELLYDSDVEDHRTGRNWTNTTPFGAKEHYVTPMLAGYDNRFHGSYTECGDYIENPENSDLYIRHMYWADCMKKSIAPK